MSRKRIGRASVTAAVSIALVAQMVSPALARADADLAPATATPPPIAREDRQWVDLVRACTANARHVRLQFSGVVTEIEEVVPEATGVRFRAPHLGVRSAAITETSISTDTLVSWSAISKVEVRNVASRKEGAASGLGVGFLVGLPVALLVGFATAFDSRKNNDATAGWALLGAAALGMAVGAAGTAHPNGGWVTCCERDTSALTTSAESTH